MISDYDEEDEEVVFQRLSLNTNYPYPRASKDLRIAEEDCQEEEIDIYQQLAEKDHYLILAAEAGKVLLEKNQELTKHFEALQEEYLQKIEGLEQDRHYLRKELNERGVNYESRMQELQSEISNLGGQLQMVQKSSRTIENSTQSTYDSLIGQNSTLLHELDKVKSYNRELTQHVELLTGRLDEHQNAVAEKVRPDASPNENDQDPYSSDVEQSEQIGYTELLNLKETVRQLTDQKDFLEESLNELVKEKYATVQQDTDGKVSNLEEDVSNLRQQMLICQEELQLTRRKNEHLKDQLEEYVLMQSVQQPATHLNTSLLNELELSIPEVDMNFRCMSTPLKNGTEVGKEEDIPSIQVSHADSQTNYKYEKLKMDLQQIYKKLRHVKNKLTNDTDEKDIETDFVSVEDITKIVDEVIELIRIRTMALGLIDNNAENQCQLEIDNCDNLSQPDSQTSDRDTDILEQQVHDLNQRLNITTFELDKVKKDLLIAQTTASESQDIANALSVKTNCQEREVDNLRREREILLNDKTMDDNLKKALEDRDDALQRENEIKAKYETAQSDMKKLNDQLIAAVQQKLELSEQLEQWQFDMATLIDQQLSSKVKRDNQKSRKRNAPSSNPARAFAAKLFTNKSSKEMPR